MREKQPQSRTIDLRKETRGNYAYSALIVVSPYFSIKNEDCYSRNVTVVFYADDMSDAHGFAQAVSAVISFGHDIYQTNIQKIFEGAEL